MLNRVEIAAKAASLKHFRIETKYALVDALALSALDIQPAVQPSVSYVRAN